MTESSSRGYESEEILASDSEPEKGDNYICGTDQDSEPDLEELEELEEFPKRKKIKHFYGQTPNASHTLSTVKCSSVPAKRITPISRVQKGSSSQSTPTHAGTMQPKALKMQTNGKEATSVLGEITNMLGKVIERLDRTETKLESLERQFKNTSSSSGSEGKRIVPTVVRVCSCVCACASLYFVTVYLKL